MNTKSPKYQIEAKGTLLDDEKELSVAAFD
jgi:hypothetical protein